MSTSDPLPTSAEIIDYFHVCPLPLEPGSVIKPGNWGRIIRSYVNRDTNINQLWIMFREQTFELIRRTEFPGKPSRFDSTFLFDSIEKSTNFKKQNNRLFDLTYRVQLTNPGAPTHVACMDLVGIPDGVRFFEALESNARKYWEGKIINSPELLTRSAIRIVERID